MKQQRFYTCLFVAWLGLAFSPLSAQEPKDQFTLKGHIGFVNSVAFSPDGKRIVSGGVDENLKVWDAATGKEVLSFKQPDWVNSVAFSPDSKQVVSGSNRAKVRMWDAATGEETLSLKGHTGQVNSVAFSPDSKRIVSGSWDMTVKVWDVSLEAR